jgi:hypothetical protein
MSEPTPSKTPDTPNAVAETERTKRVHAAGWTAGMSAFFLVGALAAGSNSWPAAIGVCGIAAMVAVACYYMLRQP